MQSFSEKVKSLKDKPTKSEKEKKYRKPDYSKQRKAKREEIQ